MNRRKAFIDTLTHLAKRDPKVMLLVGDVGFSYIESFKAKYPKQFLNVGVMEQTMMGLAVGLAYKGFKPYVYSMINFIVFRPYEQVRNDICYGNANVKLFGVAGSEAYKFLGFSHNIEPDEDEKVLYGLPNLTIHTPQTEQEVTDTLLWEHSRSGPSYMRL